MVIDGVWISPAMFQDVARLTGVHRTTVARWYERQRLPTAVRRLLRLVYHGDLSEISDAWHSWFLDPRTGELVTDQHYRSGELVTDQDYRFGPGEIRATGYRQDLVTTLQRQIRELHECLATTKNFDRKTPEPERRRLRSNRSTQRYP